MSLKGKLYLLAAMFGIASSASKTGIPVRIEGHNTHPIWKDDFSGHRYIKVYPDMNKKNTERKATHAAKVADYAKLGVHWTPHGLYWMTRQLAEEHK